MQLTVSRDDKRQPWLLAACFSIIAVCAIVLFFSADEESQALAPLSVGYLADKDNAYTLDAVRQLPPSVFTAVDGDVSLGMAPHAYWFVISLPAAAKTSDSYFFEINYPLLDQIDLWLFQDELTSAPLAQYSLGDKLPFVQRPFNHKSFIIDLPPTADKSLFAILRVQTQGSIKVPMRVWNEQDFLEYTAKVHVAAGMFIGILLAMAISNLFFFVTSRNLTFLVYTGYVVCLSLALLSLHGYGFEYLWPNNTWFQERALATFANATLMFAMFFSRRLLSLPMHSKKVSRLVSALGGIFLLNVCISLFLPYYYLIQIFLVLLLIVVVVIFTIGAWLALKGIVIARYYTLSWLVILGSAFASAFDNLDIVRLGISSSTVLLYGAVAETLLLAFVLAMSYGSQQDELNRAQVVAIDKEKEITAAKDQLLTLEQQAKDELEYKVQERTLELEITLRELSDANRELERLNTIDPLTNIRNRRYFDKRIIAEGRRSRREQTTLTLVMLDIDHFKNINDKYGHDAGDKCITHVAQIAKSYMKRPSDDVCRYGGEEYAFILPSTTAEGAGALIEQIRLAIEAEPLDVDGTAVSMTVSAGIASQIVQAEDGEKALLKLADKALYQAKEQGRNRVVTV